MPTTFTCENVLVYQIPPLKSTKAGRKAKDWDVDQPLWKGKLGVVEESLESGDVTCHIRLYESDTGDLFAEAPYSSEGKGIEPVADSSRYFAITVVDGDRRAVLGLGFTDRNESFDFNIALQTFLKHARPLIVKSQFIWETEDEGKTEGNSKKGDQSDTDAKKDSGEEGSGPVPLLPPPMSRAQVKERQKEESSPFDDDFGDFQG